MSGVTRAKWLIPRQRGRPSSSEVASADSSMGRGYPSALPRRSPGRRPRRRIAAPVAKRGEGGYTVHMARYRIEWREGPYLSGGDTWVVELDLQGAVGAN